MIAPTFNTYSGAFVDCRECGADRPCRHDPPERPDRMHITPHLDGVFAEIGAEIERAETLHGPQDHLPLGMGSARQRLDAINARTECQTAFRDGRGTWAHIVAEEHAEMLAESDPLLVRGEAIQLAAMATKVALICDQRLDTPPAAA